MKVQRVCLPDTGHISWMVLDDQYLPIQPIHAFLVFHENLGRSPNTIRAEAHHLKLFWEFLSESGIEWNQVDIAHLASFITWLRRPQSSQTDIAPLPPRRTDATIDQILSAVHTFYDFHIRMKTVPDFALTRFVMMPSQRYKPLLYGIAKTKPLQARVVKLKREERLPKVFPNQVARQLVDMCHHTRDKLLIALLYDTGMRIGQVLGLRHEDILVEDGVIRIIPRDENVNGARAKTDHAYQVYPSEWVLNLYIQYLIEDLDGLCAETLPDYVFVNLWGGNIGQPLTYAAVRSFCKKLHRQACKVLKLPSDFPLTPHMFRHTRATEWLRDDKVPLSTVSRLLGHASIKTTHDIYIHFTDEETREELEQARKRSRNE